MASGAGRPWRRARACSACVPLLVLLYTAVRVGADTAKDMYIEDTDRFPGWKGELPRTAEEDGPNTIGYGEGGVVSSPGGTDYISWASRRPRCTICDVALTKPCCLRTGVSTHLNAGVTHAAGRKRSSHTSEREL